MRTKTAKDIWLLAWHLQRLNKAGSPDFPFTLLKANNLMEYKGRRNELFLMMDKAKRCQYSIYNQIGKLNLQARFYMKKLNAVSKTGFNVEYDLDCGDCSWRGLYEETVNHACPSCDSQNVFDMAIPF